MYPLSTHTGTGTLQSTYISITTENFLSAHDGYPIHLQTLSATFHHFKNNFSDWWKLTYPDDDPTQFYNTMNRFYHNTSFGLPTFGEHYSSLSKTSHY